MAATPGKGQDTQENATIDEETAEEETTDPLEDTKPETPRKQKRPKKQMVTIYPRRRATEQMKPTKRRGRNVK